MLTSCLQCEHLKESKSLGCFEWKFNNERVRIGAAFCFDLTRIACGFGYVYLYRSEPKQFGHERTRIPRVTKAVRCDCRGVFIDGKPSKNRHFFH